MEDSEIGEIREKIMDYFFYDATEEASIKMIIDLIGWGDLGDYFQERLDKISDIKELKCFLCLHKKED